MVPKIDPSGNNYRPKKWLFATLPSKLFYGEVCLRALWLIITDLGFLLVAFCILLAPVRYPCGSLYICLASSLESYGFHGISLRMFLSSFWAHPPSHRVIYWHAAPSHHLYTHPPVPSTHRPSVFRTCEQCVHIIYIYIYWCVWVGGERVRLWAWAVMAGRWGRFDEEDTFFRRCFPRVLLSCSAERTSASGKLLSCHHLLLTYEAWTRINRPVVLEERSSVPSPLLLTSAVRLFQIRLLTSTRETELIFSFLSQKRATGFWSTAITVWE